VRSVTRANVSAQITGRVVRVNVRDGARVKAGEVLVELDQEQLNAQLAQARRAADAAGSRRLLAATEHQRYRQLVEKGVAARQKLDAAVSELEQAEAGVAAAAEKVREAEITLAYARLLAPSDGVVDRVLVDPGDLAFPGKTLVAVHNPGSLRLEANVREGMIRRLKVRDEIDVVLTAVGRETTGTVSEIVPSADPVSRSFVVKVDLAAEPDLYPGMFGRLRLRTGTREAVLVPRDAVTFVGQLKTVLVREPDGWARRFVCVGAPVGDNVEILSGLDGGEEIGLP
jgi:RND family efflux transporter MFP subunit